MTRVLLLAGTSEARQIAGALAGLSQLHVTASLAGAARSPRALGVPTRIGGFGGREGFAAYLARERVDAVLDATHPFAAEMSHRSHAVCIEAGVDYARVLRPAWRPGPGDDWVFLNDEGDAARHVDQGAVVFLATGRQGLERFDGLAHGRVYVRRIDAAPEVFPFPSGGWVVGRPPFQLDREMALFHQLGVEWLVIRNAGGTGSRAKLEAARELGIRVAMIRRPLQPDATKLESIAASVLWVRRLG